MASPYADRTWLAGLGRPDSMLAGRRPTVPARSAIRADPVILAERAGRLSDTLAAAGIVADVVPSDGVVGGGGAPGKLLPGWAVALPPSWAQPLRLGDPPVIGRVERDRLLLDLRCVPPERDGAVAAAVLAVAGA